MPKKLATTDMRPVLITVRPAKRGFIVEAAGSNDPFPCKDADDIGEAIMEILNDPTVERMSDRAAHSHSHASSHSPEEEEEEYEPEPEPESRRERASSGSTADDMVAGALSMLLEKGRKMSDWKR